MEVQCVALQGINKATVVIQFHQHVDSHALGLTVNFKVPVLEDHDIMRPITEMWRQEINYHQWLTSEDLVSTSVHTPVLQSWVIRM